MDNNTYEVMKNIYTLPRKYKENLFDNWEDIINTMSSLETKDSLRKSASTHDPETPEDIIKLIEVIEKLTNIDDDICYCNISIFIQTLLRASRKYHIRPYRVVSIIEQIQRLAKEFESGYQKSKSMTPELRLKRKEFGSNIKEVKKRLRSLDSEFSVKKKPASSPADFSENEDLENSIKIKIKRPKIASSGGQIIDKTLEEIMIEYTKILSEFSDVRTAENFLENIQFDSDPDFDSEIKREIIERTF